MARTLGRLALFLGYSAALYAFGLATGACLRPDTLLFVLSLI